MKFKAFLVMLILGCGLAYGQDTVTVSGTIVDSDSLTWINGTWSATFVNPYPNTKPTFTDNGNAVQTYYSGTLDGTGSFSISMPSNSAITPSGTSWAFTFCPQATFACSTLQPINITGAYNISAAALAGISPPRFAASGAGVYGYGDVEVVATPKPGGYYFNVTTGSQRIWNGTAWISSGGGSGTITGVSGSSGITGGGTSGNVTLALDPTVVPTLGASTNTFTGTVAANAVTATTGTLPNLSSAYFNDTVWLSAAPNSCTVGSSVNVNGTAITLNPLCTAVGISLSSISVSGGTGAQAAQTSNGQCYISSIANAPNAVIVINFPTGGSWTGATYALQDIGYNVTASTNASVALSPGVNAGSGCSGNVNLTYAVMNPPTFNTQGMCAYMIACSKARQLNETQTVYVPEGTWNFDGQANFPWASSGYTVPTVNLQGNSDGFTVTSTNYGTNLVQVTSSTYPNGYEHFFYKPAGAIAQPIFRNVNIDGNGNDYQQVISINGFASTMWDNVSVTGSIASGPGTSQWKIQGGGGTGTSFQTTFQQITSTIDSGCVGSSKEVAITLSGLPGTPTLALSNLSTCSYSNAQPQFAANGQPIYKECGVSTYNGGHNNAGTVNCVPIVFSQQVNNNATTVACSTGGLYLLEVSNTTGLANGYIDTVIPATGCPVGTIAKAQDLPPTQFGIDFSKISDSHFLQVVAQSEGMYQAMSGVLGYCTITSTGQAIIDLTSYLGVPLNAQQSDQSQYPYLSITSGSCGSFTSGSVPLVATNSPYEYVLSSSAFTPSQSRTAITGTINYQVIGAGFVCGSGDTIERYHSTYNEVGLWNQGCTLHEFHSDTNFVAGQVVQAVTQFSQDNYMNTGIYNGANYKAVMFINNYAGSIVDRTTCNETFPSTAVEFIAGGHELSGLSQSARDAYGIRIGPDTPCNGMASTPITGVGNASTQVTDFVGTVNIPGTLNATVSNATNATLATQAAATVVSASMIAGDNICAHAGDTTIASVAITGETVTGGQCTYSTAAIPVGYTPLQNIQVTGATTTGYNVANATISSVSGNNVTAPCTATGAGVSTYGTMNLYCQNQTQDAILSNPQTFLNNVSGVSFPTNTNRYEVTSGYNFWGGASAPYFTIQLYDGANEIYANTTAFALASNVNDSPATLSWALLGTSLTTLANVDITGLQWNTTYAMSNFTNSIKQPVIVPSASSALTLKAYFSASGLGLVTSASGGTISGAIGTTCLLTMTNGSGTGATATATLVTANTLTGATFATTNTGSGYTSAPTTSSVANGTATCSGTPTVVTTLGGAQGNMINVRHFEYHQ